VSFDFDALYPSIISQHNISPETFAGMVKMPPIERLLDPDMMEGFAPDVDGSHNLTFCVNGTSYRKDKRGFLPELVDQFIGERKQVKKKMIELKKAGDKSGQIEHLDNYQKALKILTNGLYGSLGQRYFRWFDLKLAEAVTTTSQLATRYVEKKLNEKLNTLLQTNEIDYVVAADTDSAYLKLDALVKRVGLEGQPPGRIIDFLDKACQQEFQPFIERCCLDVCELLNVYTPHLVMKRDVIADKAIWRGAKMYIMNVWDTEGVRHKEPELLIHGIEAIRSSTPMVCRDNIKKCLKIIMNKSEADLQEFFKTFYSEFKTMPFEQVAFPRSVNSLDDYYDAMTICKKGTPIHVRGALVYNNMIQDLELTKTHSPIRSKDKIRFAYLKEPNPAMSHVIAAPDELPPEFKLHEYIDYEMQWEKSFKAPIQSITDVINWRVEKIPTLGIACNK
jgi:DNA polymerase elongation subunit (family B)